MLTPNDTRARIAHVGLNPDDYTDVAVRDIERDIRDDYPNGCPITHRAFRCIAERNRKDTP